MMKINERRKGESRAIFERPLDVWLMTIDGRGRESVLIEMPDNGARLKVTGRAASLTECFLILNSFGPPVFRHCKREWGHGDEIGVSFNKINIGINPPLEEVRRRDAELGVGAS
jgi:hypothetical protein